jgi:predicted permease
MLTESIALSCCGALLGIFLAIAGTRLLAGLNTFKIPLLSTVQMDAASLAFSLLVALITGLLFGLAPALQIPFTSVHNSLKDSSRAATGTIRHVWIRSTLVVSEIVFACVLLVGAGLLSRSFLNVLSIDLGFQPERAAALRVDPATDFASQSQRDTYYSQVLDRVRSLSGIRAAGLTDVLPLAGDRSWAVTAQGKFFPRGQFPEGFIRIVSDGYLKAMGIPLRRGRGFTERDNRTGEPVALVNETLARTLWPGQDAIGQILMAEGSQPPGRRVVGVVGDVRHRAPEQDSGCELYMPILQRGESTIYLIVRTALPPAALASSVRAALRSIAPGLSNNEFTTIQELVDKSVSPRRFIVGLLGGFSTFALILAALGIYAVISYSVSQRTTELGIRMALGATVQNLQSRILLQTLSLAATGMILGSCAAWFLSRALGGLLFGITSSDPSTFLGAMGILTVVACLASYLPALRVSKIEPMAALRAT